MDQLFFDFDKVIVSGSFTGHGDQAGIIYESNYSAIGKGWFHLVSLVAPALEQGQEGRLHVSDRFLTLCE